MTQTLYNCRTIPSGWTFVKFDGQLNIDAIYTVTATSPSMTCDCPGWPRRSACKHTRMVSTFALAGAIDTSQFYCYETQTWHQPIQGPWDQDDPGARKAAELAEAAGLDRHLRRQDEALDELDIRDMRDVVEKDDAGTATRSPPPKSSIRRV